MVPSRRSGLDPLGTFCWGAYSTLQRNDWFLLADTVYDKSGMTHCVEYMSLRWVCGCGVDSLFRHDDLTLKFLRDDGHNILRGQVRKPNCRPALVTYLISTVDDRPRNEARGVLVQKGREILVGEIRRQVPDHNLRGAYL